jgi:hypothetical protein
MRSRDGSWVASEPALWAWKYALDGFATQDLWLNTQDRLPDYLSGLGRDYLLTSLRVFEVASGAWRVAWASNGAGHTPGADFGTFEARESEGSMVMTSLTSHGHQRVTFSQIQRDSFTWTSEYSNDGESWTAVMRVHARRLK